MGKTTIPKQFKYRVKWKSLYTGAMQDQVFYNRKDALFLVKQLKSQGRENIKFLHRRAKRRR